MAVNKIISSVPTAQSNMWKSVMNYGSKNTFVEQFLVPSGQQRPFDIVAEESRLSPNYGTFSLGAGLQIGVTGIQIFTNASGGSLENLSLINSGPQSVYIAINSSSITTASGAIQIPTGSGFYIYDSVIQNIWAITASSSGRLTGGGMYNFNPNVV